MCAWKELEPPAITAGGVKPLRSYTARRQTRSAGEVRAGQQVLGSLPRGGSEPREPPRHPPGRGRAGGSLGQAQHSKQNFVRLGATVQKFPYTEIFIVASFCRSKLEKIGEKMLSILFAPRCAGVAPLPARPLPPPPAHLQHPIAQQQHSQPHTPGRVDHHTHTSSCSTAPQQPARLAPAGAMRRWPAVPSGAACW